MTTYIVSGTTLQLDIDGGDGSIALANTINPITGGMGLNTVRIINASTANLATVNFTPSDVTYEFTNVSGTASGSGANATFDVTVANSGYQVAIANAGSGYANAETITILGNALGGTTTANDLTLTVTVATVGNVTGTVASVSTAGTQLWPQSVTGEISLLPSSESFIQITTNASIGAHFESTGSGGNLYITPVTIVG